MKDRIVKTDEENCHNTLEERLAEQDHISFKAGIKEVVEWIKANANLERGDRDVGLCFEDFLYFDYETWQAKLKEWGIE